MEILAAEIKAKDKEDARRWFSGLRQNFSTSTALPGKASGTPSCRRRSGPPRQNAGAATTKKGCG